MDRATIDEQIREIASDLTTLEIDTILKENMSATKMPPVRHALIDLGQDYKRTLAQILSRAPAQTSTSVDGISQLSENDQKDGSSEAFDLYRRTAKAILDTMADTSLSNLWGDTLSTDQLMAVRIQDTSDQMKGLLKKYGDNDYTRREVEFGVNDDPKRIPAPIKLAPKDLVLLRKAWDVGTERVAMQTVIQIDGNVITRLAPSLANDPLVLSVHRDSVQFSVGFWNQLVVIVTNFLDGLFGKIFG